MFFANKGKLESKCTKIYTIIVKIKFFKDNYASFSFRDHFVFVICILYNFYSFLLAARFREISQDLE